MHAFCLERSHYLPGLILLVILSILIQLLAENFYPVGI